MCKAPKPPKPKEPKKPMFLRNRYLDEFVGEAQAVNSLRTGRSSLRIDMGSALAVGGRSVGDSLVRPPAGQPTTGRRGPSNGALPGFRQGVPGDTLEARRHRR